MINLLSKIASLLLLLGAPVVAYESDMFSDRSSMVDLMNNIAYSYDSFEELILEDGEFNTVDRQNTLSSNMKDYRAHFESLHAYFQEEGASLEEWNQFNKLAMKYADLSDLLTRRLLGEDIKEEEEFEEEEEDEENFYYDREGKKIKIDNTEDPLTHRSNETLEEEVDHLKKLMARMEVVKSKLGAGTNITDPEIKKEVYDIGDELETMNQDKAVVEFEEVCDFLKMMIKEEEDKAKGIKSDFESDDPERVQKAIEENNNQMIADMFMMLTDIEETLVAPNGGYDYLHKEFEYILEDFNTLDIEDQSTKDKLSKMIKAIKPKLYSDEILVPKIVDVFEEAAWEKEYEEELKKEEEEENDYEEEEEEDEEEEIFFDEGI